MGREKRERGGWVGRKRGGVEEGKRRGRGKGEGDRVGGGEGEGRKENILNGGYIDI